jgi:hypothetical protein
MSEEPREYSDMRTWRELFPEGRVIIYDGDDPEGFAAEIKEEFGYDPSEDEGWGRLVTPHPGPFDKPFVLHEFHCPPEHLDAIYSSGRWPMGS